MFEVELASVKDLSESTREFRFARLDGGSLDYKPGQFYRFTFTDQAGEFERSYSLCNYDELYGQHLDLVISRVEAGRATRLLLDADWSARAAGNLTARVTGPYGRLVLPDVMPGKLVMVATSVGIAPFMPMLKTLDGNLGSGQLVLLLGARDRSEFIFQEQLLDLATRLDNFDLRVCYSRETSVQAPFERLGYVTRQIQDLVPDASRDYYLLCGNPKMIDDCWGNLQAQGLRHQQVIREKYEFARQPAKRLPGQAMTEEQKKLIAEKMARHSPSAS